MNSSLMLDGRHTDTITAVQNWQAAVRCQKAPNGTKSLTKVRKYLLSYSTTVWLF